MKNFLTGILIIVFFTVYSVSLNLVNFSFKKQSENNICGFSIGNNFNEYKFNGLGSRTSLLKGALIESGTDSFVKSIDSEYSGDLFAVNQEKFSFGNYTSSQFISRENQIPKEFFTEPVELPS